MFFILILVGFVLLILSADFLIKSALAISDYFKMSKMFSGLFLLALGTSLPELLISTTSVRGGNFELAFGSLVGSNLFNILLIGGIVFLIGLKQKVSYYYEMCFVLTSALVFLIFFHDNTLTLLEAFFSLSFTGLFLAFMFYFYRDSSNSNEEEKYLSSSIYINFLIFFISSGFVFLGAEMTVRGCLQLSESYGLSHRFAGVLILAIGSGLPELMTSLVASLKKQPQLALGNIFGSNIFNIALIPALSSVMILKPFTLTENDFLLDKIWLFVVTLVFCLTIIALNFLYKKRFINLVTGFLFLLGYAIYFYSVVIS